MIGYGTPDSRPCHKCTSVPQTSEYTVFKSIGPCAMSGSGNSRSSIGARGAVMTAARIMMSTCYYRHMPLFEYRCQDCDHRFEILMRAETRLECPACHGAHL